MKNSAKKAPVLAGSEGFEPSITSSAGLSPICPSPIDYPGLRSGFVSFLESKRFDPRYREGMLSYLDRYVKTINGPMDILRLFSGLSGGQQHNLNRGVRNLFNFLGAQGFDEDYLNLLRKNIPRDAVGFDINIPSPEAIVSSLRVIADASPPYRALYELVLDSGLRLVEACRFINSLEEARIERLDGFCVAPLGYFRRSKAAYFAFFTEETRRLMAQLNEKIDARLAASYRRNRPGAVGFKYLRKFANDTMTSEELSIPESVADFIQGRVPKTVGAMHYMRLKRKAIEFYPRYAEYVRRLRQAASCPLGAQNEPALI